MISIQYKYKQEEILIKEIASSSFVTKDILYEIKKYYNEEVPYHNFLHALQVSKSVLKLNPKYFNILEIKSLFFAAIFHDAGHTGHAKLLDEFNSLDIALKNLLEFNEKHNIGLLNETLIRKAIVGTVFTKRGQLKDRFAKILGDLDIGILGGDFLEFCYYGFPFGYELGQNEKEYIQKTEIGYFKYLFSFNKDILLTDEAKEIYPNILKNIKIFINTDLQVKIDMMKTIKNEDITYHEFYKKYKNNYNLL